MGGGGEKVGEQSLIDTFRDILIGERGKTGELAPSGQLPCLPDGGGREEGEEEPPRFVFGLLNVAKVGAASSAHSRLVVGVFRELIEARGTVKGKTKWGQEG